MNISYPVLVLLSGPAGSGKSTLCDRYVTDHPDYSRVVTSTTRSPRAGEVNGVHYHFFSPEEFRARINRGDFLEWALVHGEYHDRLYGTLRSSIVEPLNQGRKLIMNLDVQGAESLRTLARVEPLLRRAMTTIFIQADIEILMRRMGVRGTDTADEIQRRMTTAAQELLQASKFDHIIDSKTRDEDYEELCRFVTAAELRAAA
ncbi:MAG TPA: guanylate kinase [Candidatus Paceibacterota bacterium]